MKSIVLYDLPGTVDRYHQPVLVCFDQGFGVIDNADTLYYYQSIDCKPITLNIENCEIFTTLKKVLRIGNKKSVGNNHKSYIIFSESILPQNPRYMCELNFDIEKERIRWNRLFELNCNDFPHDRFGGLDIDDGKNEEYNEPPIIGSSMIKGNKILIFAEGTDSMSVNRYGMDYYSLCEVDRNGKIMNWLYEKSGLKQISGKHGVRGTFSSSKEYVILTPVFSSGDWKGKQKLFDLANNKLLDIQLPRGMKSFQIIDCFDNIFYLTNFEDRIVLCNTK